MTLAAQVWSIIFDAAEREEGVRAALDADIAKRRDRTWNNVILPALGALKGSNPDGLCQCGCGERTPLARGTNKRKGTVKGYPVRYVPGHQCVKTPMAYIVDDTTGCWVWQRGGRGRGGAYGAITKNHKTLLAHRYYYETLVGPVPEGMQLDHLCGNTRCVNPAHLEPVTNTTNTRRGASTKVTVGQVVEMRQLAKFHKITPTALSVQFGIDQAQVRRILSGKCWADIPMPGASDNSSICAEMGASSARPQPGDGDITGSTGADLLSSLTVPDLPGGGARLAALRMGGN